MIGRHRHSPVTPYFQKIMRQAHHTPFAANLLEASQRKATETPPFFALTTHRFHDDLAPGVPRTTWLTAHLSRHARHGAAHDRPPGRDHNPSPPTPGRRPHCH